MPPLLFSFSRTPKPRHHPILIAVLTISAAAFGGSAFGQEATPAALSVFSDGKPDVFLEESAEKDESLVQAISDFRRCFKEMTGVELPTSASAGRATPIRFQIALPNGVQANEEQAADWHDYRIDVGTNGIVIDAVSPLGAANGLYGLLDRWGCRWIMPGAIGECIPKASSLDLPIGVISGKLATDMRVKTYHGGSEGKLWVLRNRNKFGRYLPTDHNWTGPGKGAIAPVEIYNDPKKTETYHPEYYALVGGIRTPTQICTTHPDMIKLAVEAADRFFAWAPLADSFPLEPNDNIDFCQCENCMALDPKVTTPDGLPLMTDRVIAFANEVARELRKTHPGKKVGIFAYLSHSLPPAKIKPEPEVIVGVCRSNYDMYRLVPREDGDSASQFYQLIRDWKKLTPHVFVYEYNPIYWNANLFSANYLELAQTIKDTRALGSFGTYTDGMIYYDNSTNFVNNYMLFRLSADDQLDPQKELESMCKVFYGPAAASMYAYYKTMAETTQFKVPEGAFFGGGFRHYFRLFNPDMIKKARAELEEARQSSPPESLFNKRVELASLNQEYLEAYLNGVWKAQQKDYRGSVEAFNRMEGLVGDLAKAQMLVDNPFGPADTLFKVKGLRQMVLNDYFPEKFGMLTRWKMLGPLDNSDRKAEMTKASFEPLKAIDKSIPISGGEALAWREIESTSGFIDLRKNLHKVNPEWTAFTAYLGVNIESQSRQEVQLRMNSFNSFRVFLNGKEVFYRPGLENDLPDGNKIAVILEKGRNVLVIKSTHTSDSYAFPWGLYCRITTPEGMPVSGLNYSL